MGPQFRMAVVRRKIFASLIAMSALAAYATAQSPPISPVWVPIRSATSEPKVAQVQRVEPLSPPGELAPKPESKVEPVLPVATPGFDLDQLIQLAIERNPRIARATIAIDAAQGRQIQAGLYPNPVLAAIGDELGDRTGPGGIWSAPQLTQEIVTGRKLSLSQAVAGQEVNQATLNVINERYAVVGSVRAAFYETLALQARLEILRGLAGLAESSVDTGRKLLDKGLIARLDLIQLEVELERVRAESDAVARELPGAFRRLAAATGDPDLAYGPLSGRLETPLPGYDLEAASAVVRDVHPEVRSAKVEVERNQIALRRAQVEPIPNVTLSTGYTRQNQNRSSDWMIGVSLPIPTWNRNQGNIRAAQANVGMSVQDVARVQNSLVERLATAYRAYAAAKARADRYRDAIVPKAAETYRLSTEAFKGGQFEYLRVVQAQRALFEARVEYVRSLGEAWRGAAEMSALLLEESWPPRPK